MVDLAYNSNEREHVNFADTLGGLQRGIVKGTIHANTDHAYYIGLELLQKFPNARGVGEKFLKCDATGAGAGNGRSKNRVVTKVNSAGALIEGEAWIWRHDNRVEKMGKGFFERAVMYRNM